MSAEVGGQAGRGGRLHIDRATTPLNACSLEVLHRPLNAVKADGDDDDDAPRRVLPLVVGCYQLNEGASASDDPGDSAPAGEDAGEVGATRSGELRLHLVETECGGAPPPAFGAPAQVTETESGVLDGKWCESSELEASGDTGRCGPAGGGGGGATERYLYGTACASGRVRVYSLDRGSGDAPNGDGGEGGWRLRHLVSSSENSDAGGGGGKKRLCLSLDWDLPPPSPVGIGSAPSTAFPGTRRIVSSYSDGTLAVHNLVVGPTGDGDEAAAAPLLEEVRTWDAHRLFGVPAEVWTTCFAGDDSEGGGHSNVVASGADDCTLKLWDLRTPLRRPTISVGEEEYGAGVTAVARHPRLRNVLAAGSYDESLRFWDVRSMSEPLCRAEVGGGVWRVRWHPSDDGRVLVAAMHGGCRVVDVAGLGAMRGAGTADGGVEAPAAAEIVAEFREHESMAYGADWLVPKRNGGDGGALTDSNDNSWVAASCSFYDRQAFIWDGGKGDRPAR